MNTLEHIKDLYNKGEIHQILKLPPEELQKISENNPEAEGVKYLIMSLMRSYKEICNGNFTEEADLILLISKITYQSFDSVSVFLDKAKDLFDSLGDFISECYTKELSEFFAMLDEDSFIKCSTNIFSCFALFDFIADSLIDVFELFKRKEIPVRIQDDERAYFSNMVKDTYSHAITKAIEFGSPRIDAVYTAFEQHRLMTDAEFKEYFTKYINPMAFAFHGFAHLLLSPVVIQDDNGDWSTIKFDKVHIEDAVKYGKSASKYYFTPLNATIEIDGEEVYIIPDHSTRERKLSWIDAYVNILSSKNVSSEAHAKIQAFVTDYENSRPAINITPEIPQNANDYPESGKKGCYVATAVYGSYDCPEVWTLRRFRDDTLGATWRGRLFIRSYYLVSPVLVKWFGKTEWFKRLWRTRLDKMVVRLNDSGVKNTPYKDKEW